MRSIARRHLFVASLAFAVGVVTNLAHGNDKNGGGRGPGHDEAWSARQGGKILPLPKVLGIVGPKIDGEIIETEFEYEHGRPVYEFKYVDRNGRVRELYVDARTGTILKDEPD